MELAFTGCFLMEFFHVREVSAHTRGVSAGDGITQSSESVGQQQLSITLCSMGRGFPGSLHGNTRSLAQLLHTASASIKMYEKERKRSYSLLLFWECDILATRCILILFHRRLLGTVSLGFNFLSIALHWNNGQQNPRMGLLCVRYNINKVRVSLSQQVYSLKDKRRWRKMIFQVLSRLISGWTLPWIVPHSTEFVSSPSLQI